MDKKPNTSNRRLLLQLAAIQTWRRPGGSNFVSKNWYESLFSENRRVTIRMIKSWSCFACGAKLPPDSTGDHLLAKAEGGSDALENFAPLCQPCNSSKGAKDLLVWWHSKSWALARMSADVICAFSRVKFAHLHAAGRLDEPADPQAVALVDAAIRELPYAKQTILAKIGGEKADFKTEPAREKLEGALPTDHRCGGERRMKKMNSFLCPLQEAEIQYKDLKI